MPHQPGRQHDLYAVPMMRDRVAWAPYRYKLM